MRRCSTCSETARSGCKNDLLCVQQVRADQRVKKEKASLFGEAFFNPGSGVLQAEDVPRGTLLGTESSLLTALVLSGKKARTRLKQQI